MEYSSTYFIIICILITIASNVCAAPDATTLDNKPFDVDKDIETLHNIMKTKGKFADLLDDTSLEALVNITALRTLSQRMEMSKMYQKKYQANLPSMMVNFATYKKSCLRYFLVRLFETPMNLKIKGIKFSLELGKEDWGYRNIILSSNGTELKEIARLFNEYYKQTLPDLLNAKIKDEKVKKFITTLVDNAINDKGRPSFGVDQSKIDAQVHFIPTRIFHCSEKNNKDFYDFLLNESFEQMKAVMDAFHAKHNSDDLPPHQMTKYCINNDVTEVFKYLLLYVYDPAALMAAEMYKGTRNQGKVRDGLDRNVIIGRETNNMPAIINYLNPLTNDNPTKYIQDKYEGYESIKHYVLAIQLMMDPEHAKDHQL